MGISIADNFNIQMTKPLDGRIKYDTLAAMKAMADSTLYDGCIAYCVGEDKNYQWKSTNTVDATTGKWREFSSGGGSDDNDMSPEDLEDVKSNFNITLRDIPEAMSAADLEDIKDAFVLD